jgi:tetratricopeptide (TPR) repeat protein
MESREAEQSTLLRRLLRTAYEVGQTISGCSSAAGLSQADIDEILETGRAHHRAGRLSEAETHYWRVLDALPRHADALHLLGVLASQVGRHEIALRLIGDAIRQNGDDPSYHRSCGVALRALGRLEAAVASFASALALRSDFPEALIDRGLALEDLGRLDEALESYDRASALRPGDPALHNHRGLVLHMLQRHEEALESFRRALALRPDDAAALNNRGVVLHLLGRHDEALESYDRLLPRRPEDADLLGNRGTILQALGRFDEALDNYERALTLAPDHLEVLNNRGFLLCVLTRFDDALRSFDRAVALKPDFVAALKNRANALTALARFSEALDTCDRALAHKPDDAEILNNRGNILFKLNRFDEALGCYERALALKPDDSELLNNRGNALCELDRLEEARDIYARALDLNPRDPRLLSNLGNALVETGRFDEALRNYDRAVTLEPDSYAYQINRAFLLLRLGRFAEGWAAYEWRRREANRPGRAPPGPELRKGEPVTRRLLLYAEQGLGDTIQFCRFASLVAAQGAQVFLEAQPPLAGLLQSLQGVDVFPSGHLPPQYEVHLPLMSLPHVLDVDAEKLRHTGPYLFAEPERTKMWARRLPANGFRVGIVWQGSRTRPDKGRSIPLRAFAPLSRIPGVVLISLQKGYGVEQLVDLPSGMTVATLGADFDSEPGDFRDTAAIMRNLDLVISSDTSSAHLAGALGCPVWIALKQVPDWRWMIDREDTPWYPTARLFRQTRRHVWDEVLDRIAAELCVLVAAKTAARAV